MWPHVHELNELRIQRLEESHKSQQDVEGQIVEFIKFIDDAKKNSNTTSNESLPSYRKQVQQLAYDVKAVYDKVSSFTSALDQTPYGQYPILVHTVQHLFDVFC